MKKQKDSLAWLNAAYYSVKASQRKDVKAAFAYARIAREIMGVQK